jgi:hypothetical protein
MQVFAFGDDPAWTRQRFGDLASVRVIEGFNPQEDLWLMSRCRHHVIANSSFSWWGAYLADGEGQRVFAPAWWYRERPTTRDLVPDSWELCDNR